MASTSSGEAIRALISDTENEPNSINSNTERKIVAKRKIETTTDTDLKVSQVNIVRKISEKTIETEKMDETNDEDPEMVKAFTLKSKKRRITDESDSKFSHPMGAKFQTKETAKEETPIKNRFQASSKIIIENDMHVTPPQRTETNNNRVENKEKPRRLPPPIIIHGVFKDHKYLNNFLSSKLKEKYHWKHSPNTTILQVSSYEDWVVANKNFETGKLEYHTYTPKEDKTHAFVLKGLYHDVDMDQIKKELIIDYKIPVKTIYLMKGTKFQLYMIVTSNNVMLKHLEQHVKYIDHTVIKWERHLNTKKIIQCHRCQMWGHATTNCRASPRCLKCAQQHLTNQCQKSLEDPVKCVNCGEEHVANSVKCKVYQDKLWQLEQKNTRVPPSPQMRYVAASAPKTNAWMQRQQRTPTQDCETRTFTSAPEEFPPLPQRISPSAQNPPTQQNLPVQQSPSAQQNLGTKQFSNIQAEFKRIHQIIDMDLMLQRVRLLADQLTECTSESQKFQVFYNFMTDIDNNVI